MKAQKSLLWDKQPTLHNMKYVPLKSIEYIICIRVLECAATSVGVVTQKK